ncbi:cytochrome C biogenesis protein [Sulfurifustis variabilis]|uniref:Cytochrome C biogenesis protein n=1 Tax=Sulfurifustis variabilis TaxID=1675686 RepID=A0A1B4VC31_9GAMM|nr:cytochrome c biogenesis protein CcsA [Sulfurifustis variabilis]BAU48641.1 cytochrome C biogenesis protein [Sulfurifustis variabilis]
MTHPVLNFLAIAAYAAVGLLLAARLGRGEAAAGAARTSVLAGVLAAVAFHGWILYTDLQLGPTLNLSLTSAFSLVAWVVACLYLLASLYRPIDNLGVVIMPLAALTVLVEWAWPSELPIPMASRSQAIHIVVSFLAYALLCLAAVQSLMLLAQESRLRRKQAGGFVRALPPMQTMEDVMFEMLALGFVLLSLTLVSGVFFSEHLFGKPLPLTHHVVLSALAWVVYGVLLLGRWQLGWRGRQAVRWTLGGFALLVLAYFGTKFVLEVILAR